MARRRSEEARRIGGRIAALRERHHLTQEAAATKLKVAYRTYQSWEQGTSVPRWATRERIAKFYGVAIEEVNGPPLGGEDSFQLDRIEEKLDRLLAREALSVPAAPSPGEAIDRLTAEYEGELAEGADAGRPGAAPPRGAAGARAKPRRPGAPRRAR